MEAWYEKNATTIRAACSVGFLYSPVVFVSLIGSSFFFGHIWCWWTIPVGAAAAPVILGAIVYKSNEVWKLLKAARADIIQKRGQVKISTEYLGKNIRTVENNNTYPYPNLL